MESSTIYLILLAIHFLISFVVSISIVTCPFRFGSEKCGLLLLTWFIPIIGAVVVRSRLGYLGSSLGGSSGSSVAVDVPPSNSSGSSDGGGGCD